MDAPFIVRFDGTERDLISEFDQLKVRIFGTEFGYAPLELKNDEHDDASEFICIRHDDLMVGGVRLTPCYPQAFPHHGFFHGHDEPRFAPLFNRSIYSSALMVESRFRGKKVFVCPLSRKRKTAGGCLANQVLDKCFSESRAVIISTTEQLVPYFQRLSFHQWFNTKSEFVPAGEVINMIAFPPLGDDLFDLVAKYKAFLPTCA